MKLTDKSSAILILSAAASPLLVCLCLGLLGSADAGILAAVYMVFGLPFVLVMGWALTFAAKKSRQPLLWTTVGYVVPAFVINAVIIGVSLGSKS